MKNSPLIPLTRGGDKNNLPKPVPLGWGGKFDPENSGENRGSFSKPIPFGWGGKRGTSRGSFIQSLFFAFFLTFCYTQLILLYFHSLFSMVNTQPKDVLGTVSPEAELAKIAAVSPKDKTLAQTRQTVDRFAGVCALTWSSRSCKSCHGTESPYIPLADASGKTQLVLKEDVKGKEELFAAFDRNETPEEKLTFNKLSPEYQQKVLNFYQIGKGEQPNEVKLLKGVYNLMYAYDNISIAQRAFTEYNKTGRMPSAQPLGLKSFMRHIKWAFPSAQTVVDMETITRIDVLIQSMYDTIIAKWEDRIAKWEDRIAKWEERIRKLQEDIRIINSLIQAL